MTTSARALKLQIAELSGVEIADGQPIASGIGALARLCGMNAQVPLHHEQKYGDGAVGFSAKANPMYADIAARFASWVSNQKAGCGSADCALLEHAGSLMAALVYLEDPMDPGPRDAVSLRTCWERLRRAQVPALLNVPQLEGLQHVQSKYLTCGVLESAAVLLSRDDNTLHRGGLVCLNALLAHSFLPAQKRLYAFLVRAGGEGTARGIEAFGARGQSLMQHLAYWLDSAGGNLKRYKRLRKCQLAFPSTVTVALGDDMAIASSTTGSADFGWGSAGFGRMELPEKGSVVYQEWAMAGQGGGGGGGGASGNPTTAHARALMEQQDLLGPASTLCLALGAIENMCRGGYLALQLSISAQLPAHTPPPQEAKVQETEMSKQARSNILASARACSVLEELITLLKRTVPCLVLAVRYEDCSILDLGHSILSCLSATVDGLCSRNQTLLIEAGVPALLMQIVSLSYRPIEGAGTGGTPNSSAQVDADNASSTTATAADANLCLATTKVAAGNLLRHLVLACSALYTQRSASDEMATDGAGLDTDTPFVPILKVLETQMDCHLLAQQAAANASELDFEDIGLDHTRGRQLLQEEVCNYLIVLRTLESEVDSLPLSASTASTWSSSPSPASSSSLPRPFPWKWEGPSQALQRMQRQSPRLWAFASERVRCVELLTNAATPSSVAQRSSAPTHSDATQQPDDALEQSGGLEGVVRGRRVKLWFALSDHLFEWNRAGGTARAAERTWDALHANGGRGGALTHGLALLQCWDEGVREFVTWRALRGATWFTGAVAPGAAPEVGPNAHCAVSGAAGGQGGKVSVRGGGGVKSPASMATAGRSSSLNKSPKGKTKRDSIVCGVGVVAGKGIAERLRWSEGMPCVLSLLVMIIFLGAYGIPAEEPVPGVETAAGDNGAMHQGQFNVSADMLAWGRAGALYGSGPRWSTPSNTLELYNPWRFAPWAHVLLLVLSSLHVVATACQIASWFLNDWPVLFLKISADERLVRRRAVAGEKRPSTTLSTRPKTPITPMDVVFVDARMLMRLLTVSMTPYYLMVLGIFSLLGAVHSPLFLLAHTVRLLQPLERAARLAAPQLLRTGCIALLILVCYGLFAFSYFANHINTVSRTCNSPWQCVSTMILAALARDNDFLAHDEVDFTETPPLFTASSWEQFRALYSVTFLVVWGFLLQGALFAHILDAFVQLRQLDEAREVDCETLDLLTAQPRSLPKGVGAHEDAMLGRLMAAGSEGAGSMGAHKFEADAHSPASWVLFVCWASEQVRGSRWVLVDEVLHKFVERDPRFLPLDYR